MCYNSVAGLYRVFSGSPLRTYGVRTTFIKRSYERFCSNLRTSRGCAHAVSSALPSFFITTPIYYLNSGSVFVLTRSNLSYWWFNYC